MTLLDIAPIYEPPYVGFWTTQRLVLAIAIALAIATVAVVLIVRAAKKRKR